MNLSELQNIPARCSCGHNLGHKFDYIGKVDWYCCRLVHDTLNFIYEHWIKEIALLCKKIGPVNWFGDMLVLYNVSMLISLQNWRIYQPGGMKIKISRSEFLARMRAIACARELAMRAIDDILPQPIAEEINAEYYSLDDIVNAIDT